MSMATATKPRQATQHKGQGKAAEVSGEVTCDVLFNGRYISLGVQTYRGETQRAGARKSAQEWAERTKNARAVDHYRDADKKQHHDAFCEPGRTGDGKPADGGWEFDTCNLSAKGLRAVDLVETPAPVSGWQREYTRNGATYDAPGL